jgi:hypothetical protein
MKSAVISIKNVPIGMRVKIARHIDPYNALFGKDESDKIGTVVDVRDCRGCTEYMRKRCSQYLIIVELDGKNNDNLIAISCNYTFTTLQGYRIVSEGEYKYGGGKKL